MPSSDSWVAKAICKETKRERHVSTLHLTPNMGTWPVDREVVAKVNITEAGGEGGGT